MKCINLSRLFGKRNDRRAFRTFAKKFGNPLGVPQTYEWPYRKYLVHIEEAKRFVTDCLQVFHLPGAEASSMADILVAADYRGVYGEGIARLEGFITKIFDGTLELSKKPIIVKETLATALVDGQNGIGVMVGNFCMDLAKKKALDCGIGWVNARMSNDLFLASWYTIRAMQDDLIGIVMSNNHPMVLPTNSRSAILGSNTFAFGALGKMDHVMFDMATSVKSFSDILYYDDMTSNLPTDKWALDFSLRPTSNSCVAAKAQNLPPVGGHKGYALGSMIDILSGVLANANFLKKVPKWKMTHSQNPANLGQLFIAINPQYFDSSFKKNLDNFNDLIRTTDHVMGQKVFMPGEMETTHMCKVEAANGIEYNASILKRSYNLARWLGVKPINCF